MHVRFLLQSVSEKCAQNGKLEVIIAWYSKRQYFLLSDGQSPTQLIQLFSKLNKLNVCVLWSMVVFIFIFFVYAEDSDNYFWRMLKILFWPLFAIFLPTWPKGAFLSVISQQLNYWSFWNKVIYCQMNYVEHLKKIKSNFTSERCFLANKCKHAMLYLKKAIQYVKLIVSICLQHIQFNI